MGEVLEIRTGTAVSDVVEQLAKTMGSDTICLPVPESVAEGEWVRFNIQLEDGTHVIEGVGRSAGAVPRGNPPDRYDLYLSELSFDERNEVMYERMLIAKEASALGDDTGTIQLEDVAMEHVEDKKSSATRSVPPPPPSKLPPAKSKAKSKSPKKRTSVAPKKRTSVAPKKRTSVAPKKRASVAPEKRGSTPPASRRSELDQSGVKTKADNAATKVDVETPGATPRERGPSRRPAAISDGPYTLEVPFDLVARARGLQDRIPRKLLGRDRTPGHPEAAVLKTAVRVGLAALEAIADEE